MTVTDQVASVLGIDKMQRQKAVESLYWVTERDPAVYWLQLLIATGIAHLGLVLNSTAVVIGAMLVSPLMTPIIQLGMAFTMGSFYFAMKSGIRIITSFMVVVGFAALITKFMPFEQVTSEILSRTQPTALDLVVALFCGLAGAFSTARISRDTVTAAAGTAIAIALVPPLCVIGFGIGIRSNEIALGANLLFIANLAAIILVSNLFFFLTGFARINVTKLEDEVLDQDDLDSRLYKMAKGVKTSPNRSRWQSFRIFLPLAFVVIVLLPLSEALKRVAWEVNVKKGVQQVLTDFEEEHRVLSRYQVVSHGTVNVRLTIVGEPGEEEKLVQRLMLKIATISGAEPNVTLDVIPSKEFMSDRLEKSSEWVKQQLAGLQLGHSSPQMLSPEEAAKNLPPTYFHKRLSEVMNKVMAFIRVNDKEAEWLEWSIDIGNRGTQVSVCRIADADLSEGARSLMAGVLQRETGIEAKIREQRIEKTILETGDSNPYSLKKKTIRKAIEAQISDAAIGVVVSVPSPEKAKTTNEKKRIEKMNKALVALLEDVVPAERLYKDASQEKWHVRFTCVADWEAARKSVPKPPKAEPPKEPTPPVEPVSTPKVATEKSAKLPPPATPAENVEPSKKNPGQPEPAGT
jgi:uncharacterized hydrophobic protein (TIGR00271 family)